MLLFDAQQSQGFSDKSFDHLDSNSGIPDINSAPRRKVERDRQVATNRV
jgi:hypothetical protein